MQTVSVFFVTGIQPLRAEIFAFSVLVQMLKARNQENGDFSANFLTPNFFLYKMKDID